MLSLQESDIDEPALFIHGGIEQLVIPLTGAEAGTPLPARWKICLARRQ